MEKISKIIIGVIIISIIAVVFVASYKRIYNDHQEKMVKVLTNKIEEAGKQCFLEKKCTGKTVTIKELKKKGYLKEELVNPITKEVLNEDLKVTYKNKECHFKLS